MAGREDVIGTIAEMIVDIYVQQRIDHDEDTESEPEYRLPAPDLAYIISTQAGQYGFEADDPRLRRAVDAEFARRGVVPTAAAPES